MLHAQGHVATPEASRYLQRLCYHFSRKITVEYDSHQGQAAFAWGDCAMRADDSRLYFACQSETAEGLARVRYAIDEHVKLFSRKNPMRVQWDDGPA